MTENETANGNPTLPGFEHHVRGKRADPFGTRDLHDNGLHAAVHSVRGDNEDGLRLSRDVSNEAVVDVASLPAQGFRCQRRRAAPRDARVNATSSATRSAAAAAYASPVTRSRSTFSVAATTSSTSARMKSD